LFAEKSDVVSTEADLHPRMSLSRCSEFGSAKVENNWEKWKIYFKESFMNYLLKTIANDLSIKVGDL